TAADTRIFRRKETQNGPRVMRPAGQILRWAPNSTRRLGGMRKNSGAFSMLLVMKENSHRRARDSREFLAATIFSRPRKNEVSIRLKRNCIKRSCASARGMLGASAKP